MKKHLSISAFMFLIAAGCNQAQPLTRQDAPKEENSNKTSQYIQTNNKPTAKLGTSKWKTYADENISFKYPGDWKIRTAKVKEDRVYLYLSDSKKEYSMEGSLIEPVSISYWPNKTGGSSYLADREKTGIIQKETILIGGKQAYVEYGSKPPVFFNMRLIFTNGFDSVFSSNGQNLWAYGAKVPQQIDDTFETILSTVNFPQS